MNNNAFSFYSNVFAFVMCGFTLIGFALGVTRSHLPSNKIKTLQSLLEETENIYNSAVEEGLLTDPCFSIETKEQLYGLRQETLDLRGRVYGVTTFIEDYSQMLSGLSKTIGATCTKLKRLRANVITTSEATRRGIQKNPFDHTPSQAQSQANNWAGPNIRRPTSCPPVLSVGAHARQASLDPFADPAYQQPSLPQHDVQQ